MLVPTAARTGVPISSPHALTAISTRATKPHGLPGAGMEKRERRCRVRSGNKPRRKTRSSALWVAVWSVLPSEGRLARWLERWLVDVWPGRQTPTNDRSVRIPPPRIDYHQVFRGGRNIKPGNRLNPQLQARNAALHPTANTRRQYQQSGTKFCRLTTARTVILYVSSVQTKGITGDRDAFPTNREPCGHDQVLRPRRWQRGGRETTTIRGRVAPRTATL